MYLFIYIYPPLGNGLMARLWALSCKHWALATDLWHTALLLHTCNITYVWICAHTYVYIYI